MSPDSLLSLLYFPRPDKDVFVLSGRRFSNVKSLCNPFIVFSSLNNIELPPWDFSGRIVGIVLLVELSTDEDLKRTDNNKYFLSIFFQIIIKVSCLIAVGVLQHRYWFIFIFALSINLFRPMRKASELFEKAH